MKVPTYRSLEKQTPQEFVARQLTSVAVSTVSYVTLRKFGSNRRASLIVNGTAFVVALGAYTLINRLFEEVQDKADDFGLGSYR